MASRTCATLLCANCLRILDMALNAHWAYTDGSCLNSFSPQRIGAGVYIPSSKTSIHVNSGGVGTNNTINRAELTGIAAALSSNCTDIATVSTVANAQLAHLQHRVPGSLQVRTKQVCASTLNPSFTHSHSPSSVRTGRTARQLFTVTPCIQACLLALGLH